MSTYISLRQITYIKTEQEQCTYTPNKQAGQSVHECVPTWLVIRHSLRLCWNVLYLFFVRVCDGRAFHELAEFTENADFLKELVLCEMIQSPLEADRVCRPLREHWWWRAWWALLVSSTRGYIYHLVCLPAQSISGCSVWTQWFSETEA